MSKKLLSLLVVLALILACVPVSAAGSVMAQATFRIDNIVTDSLNAGKLTVSVQILNMSGPDRFIAAIVYYDNEGGMLDFTAKTVKPTSMLTTVTMNMDIPTTIGNDYYVRALLMDGETLAPFEVSGGTITHKGPITDVETGYTDMFERYYTLDSENGSIAMNGSSVTVADTGTAFRLKDMGEGYVGFADSGALKRRLYNNEGAVGRKLYGFGGTSMLWELEDAGDGKYYIAHYDGGYLAVENGAAVISDTPCAFELTLTGESPFTLVTSLEGYELMTEAEKQRLTEICTSAGAGIFPNGTNASSLLEIMETEFSKIYDQRGTTSAEMQRTSILNALKTTPAYSGSGSTDELTDAALTDLPGGGASISKSAVMRETLYIWDTGTKEYNRIDVTYTGYGHSQTVKFYYDETGETNVQTAIEALARFPYEYRQFLQQVNVYVPASTFSYNCDGPVLTVRVSNGTNVNSMARGFAHELGHSIDMAHSGSNANAADHWCQSAEWQKAVEDDILPVSQYGSTNLYEGFAEFARLYFQCYGSRDRMVGLKQLYPNRYASFVKLLNKIGMEPLY